MYYEDEDGEPNLDREESVERRYIPQEERKICPDCRGTGLNYIDPNDGGSCPSCIGGYQIF